MRLQRYTLRSINRIGSSFHLTSTLRPYPSRSTSTVVKSMRKIDSHLHVWAPADQADQFPFAGQLIGGKGGNEPPLPGHVEVLLEAQASPGVDGALIVQPGNHLYDHSYVTSVLRRFPNKFVGCLLANPNQDGSGVPELERLVKEEGYQAVRFNPYLWSEGEKMTNKVGKALYAKAGELGVPVGHMTFKGLMLHIDDIEELCRESPSTKVIMDHLGFCKTQSPDSEEWQRLLGLAQYPQVYVKASAFFRVSGQEWPYADAAPCIRKVIDTFGHNRVMWGSDFPWIEDKCGYSKAWSLLDGWEAQGLISITQEEKDAVLGGTLMSLFPNSFGQS